jgi:ankyrin repeat protein
MSTDDPMGRSTLHYAAADNDVAQVRRLVQGNPDIHLQDNMGWTPLHFAAQARSLEIAKLLVAGGAHVDVKDSHGNTPLGTAVFHYREAADGALIKFLRDCGADPYAANNHGQTPVGLARLIASYDVRSCFEDCPLTQRAETSPAAFKVASMSLPHRMHR